MNESIRGSGRSVVVALLVVVVIVIVVVVVRYARGIVSQKEKRREKERGREREKEREKEFGAVKRRKVRLRNSLLCIRLSLFFLSYFPRFQ